MKIPVCHLCQEVCDCMQCNLQRAAPELLEACQRMLVELRPRCNGTCVPATVAMQMAETAIFKAKGSAV